MKQNNSKKKIENLLLKMNISIKEYANTKIDIKKNMENALEQRKDVAILEEKISDLETIHNKWYKKINHNLIILNEAIDSSIYITSLKYDHRIEQLMKKIKAIKIISEKEELYKLYNNLINEKKEEILQENLKDIDKNFFNYIKKNYTKDIIIQIIYLIFFGIIIYI